MALILLLRMIHLQLRLRRQRVVCVLQQILLTSACPVKLQLRCVVMPAVQRLLLMPMPAVPVAAVMLHLLRRAICEAKRRQLVRICMRQSNSSGSSLMWHFGSSRHDFPSSAPRSCRLKECRQ